MIVPERTAAEEAVLMLAQFAPNNGLHMSPQQIALAIIDKLTADQKLKNVLQRFKDWADKWAEGSNNAAQFKQTEQYREMEAVLKDQPEASSPLMSKFCKGCANQMACSVRGRCLVPMMGAIQP